MGTPHSAVSYAKANNSLSAAIFPAKIKPTTVGAAHGGSVAFLGYNCLPRNLKFSGRQLRDFGAITASGSEGSCGPVRWLLEPIGDGDWRHIGYKTAMPGAFEIVSNVVTVGRVPDKAEMVIPVPTVSALHARIEKAEDSLLITDLDSTNGTFINKKQLKPGVVSAASPGNLITFGDTHLAMFRVYKLQKEEEMSADQEEVQGEDDSRKLENNEEPQSAV